MRFARERYADNRGEVYCLGERHWKELYGPESVFNPDLPMVLKLEEEGHFVLFTMRDEEDELVGQAAFMVFDLPFFRQVIANDAFYYIKPEYRRAGHMAELLSFAACNLQQNGVDSVVVSHHVGMDLSRVLEKAGYELTSKLYTFSSRSTHGQLLQSTVASSGS